MGGLVRARTSVMLAMACLRRRRGPGQSKYIPPSPYFSPLRPARNLALMVSLAPTLEVWAALSPGKIPCKKIVPAYRPQNTRMRRNVWIEAICYRFNSHTPGLAYPFQRHTISASRLFSFQEVSRVALRRPMSIRGSNEKLYASRR